MKKIIKISALVLLLFTMLLCAVACTSTPTKETGLKYVKYNGDSYYTVVGYNGDDAELTIPAYHPENSDIPIGRIGSQAFTGNTTIKSLVVPTSVTKIDSGAFAGMQKLEKITLPFIGANANSDAFFNETPKAEDKAVDSKRTFGYMFGTESYEGATTLTQNYDASNSITYAVPLTLREVVISPKDTYSIPMYAFAGNTLISKVTLNDKIDKIGDYAFSGCVGLTSVVGNEKTDYIGDYAFKGCSNLKTYNFNVSENNLKEIGDGAFIATRIKTVELPASVISIGDKCFATDDSDSSNVNESLIEKFSCANATVRIGNYAFYKCTYLTTVEVSTLTFDEIKGMSGVYAFDGVAKN